MTSAISLSSFEPASSLAPTKETGALHGDACGDVTAVQWE